MLMCQTRPVLSFALHPSNLTHASNLLANLDLPCYTSGQAVLLLHCVESLHLHQSLLSVCHIVHCKKISKVLCHLVLVHFRWVPTQRLFYRSFTRVVHKLDSRKLWPNERSLGIEGSLARRYLDWQRKALNEALVCPVLHGVARSLGGLLHVLVFWQGS